MRTQHFLFSICLFSSVIWALGNAGAFAADDSPSSGVSLGGLRVAESAQPGPAPRVFWRGVHVGIGSSKAVEQLTEVVGPLARLGINVIVGEINYGYQYRSHPELRTGNASSAEQIKKLQLECRMFNVRLIPQFQCLGHQSWKERNAPLLTKYPQFDETPGKYSKNESIYCRSWCLLHPEVNKVVFDLMDELIEAFDADALHVGMDEVFLIGEDTCPRCKGKDRAELFAKAVNDYYEHLVRGRKIEMLMWGDRLIDASKYNYGKWEASANDTARAIDMISKDIIICDWHYERRPAYESVPMFLEKGFRVWPASWRKPDASRAFVDYSRRFKSPRMLGHLNTTWGAVPIRELPGFEPLRYAISAFAK
ncbi:MAG: family 20 glycosylhydrolase [Phycisphaerales bacterium]|nr:MAG: family 20 glycosylhydrolase [Phycisphaerales bacterium]